MTFNLTVKNNVTTQRFEAQEVNRLAVIQYQRQSPLTIPLYRVETCFAFFTGVIRFGEKVTFLRGLFCSASFSAA